MFDNVGRKIQNVAVVFCIIGIVVSVILGVMILSDGPRDSETFGLILLLVGPLVSWLGSLLTYGFGELVENVAIIAGVEEEQEKEEIFVSKDQVVCPKCGAPISELPCPYCGWK